MKLLTTQALDVSIAQKPVCKGLDFELHSGSFWGILGGNGVGKTTLLKSLAGLHRADSGEIRVEDRALQDWRRRALACKLGVLFQDSVDSFPSTVEETAMLGRYPYLSLLASESAADRALVDDALVAVALGEMRERQVDTLSGGERQRLALATLLVQDPRIWLLDEPTNHLDLHHQISLLNLINARVRKNSGALVMVLHDINLLSRYCSHAMLMIDAGHIICGPLAEVLSDENLAALYRHPVKRVRAGGQDYFFPQ